MYGLIEVLILIFYYIIYSHIFLLRVCRKNRSMWELLRKFNDIRTA
ncbi:hypothetical protein G436_1137 [Leptospira interrogans serovar Hardjo str. Norma]|uniref:Uncharacterized protein n=1 Tax=Leptospira interrogans serovar Hardjo str. Norma TaxID=1279460 RepID=A0A0M4N3X8_LEPIR|nr:hypothetical protein G436_1137 [Leptospira interrogans serovar Hardjo str. Norma]